MTHKLKNGPKVHKFAVTVTGAASRVEAYRKLLIALCKREPDHIETFVKKNP